MDLSRLTQKSQEALAEAQALAVRSGPPRSMPNTCSFRCWTNPRDWRRGCWRSSVSISLR
jgi:hypothetical protein